MSGLAKDEKDVFAPMDNEDIDVLDLPQIYTKPSSVALLSTLDLLTIQPHSWEVTPTRTPTPTSSSASIRSTKRKIKSEGVPQYLTTIISSRLAWIQDDEEKERIWDSAAARLSERSGRTARGGFTRSFAVPVRPPIDAPSHRAVIESTPEDGLAEQGNVNISIYEPGLTADNLGHKTWAASYVLARNWSALEARLPIIATCESSHQSGNTILELGAGTGLVGLAAAAVLGARVLLTDLPEIATNLERNIDENEMLLESRRGKAEAAVLDWSDPLQVRRLLSGAPQNQADDSLPTSLGAAVVVAADPIYSAEHPILLVNAIGAHLRQDDQSVLIIAIPLRESYKAERADLRQRLCALGMKLLFEQNDIGMDDWSHGREDEPSEVECNISAWGWADGALR